MEDFARYVESRSLYVLRHLGVIIGTVTLTWDRPLFWMTDSEAAGYIHTIVVDRAFGGYGLGRDLLLWCGRQILHTGRKLSRLDCVQTNSRLREYYERAGYLHVRDKYLDEARHRGVALYQKQL